jgi:hypothetical protein
MQRKKIIEAAGSNNIDFLMLSDNGTSGRVMTIGWQGRERLS